MFFDHENLVFMFLPLMQVLVLAWDLGKTLTKTKQTFGKKFFFKRQQEQKNSFSLKMRLTAWSTLVTVATLMVVVVGSHPQRKDRGVSTEVILSLEAVFCNLVGYATEWNVVAEIMVVF